MNIPDEPFLLVTHTQLEELMTGAVERISADLVKHIRHAVSSEVGSLLATAGRLSFKPPNAGPIDQPAAGLRPPIAPSPTTAVQDTGKREAPLFRLENEQKKYRVAKGGAVKYGDIVLKEVPTDEFDATKEWNERLQHIVATDSGRALESFRRSLAHDQRFERMPGKGMWVFRKRPPAPTQIPPWLRHEEFDSDDEMANGERRDGPDG
jgi:hypothetical protein